MSYKLQLSSLLSSDKIKSAEGMNSTASPLLDNMALLSTIHHLSQFTIALVCFAGIVGNTVSAVTFLTKFLRSSICSISLASRCLNDIVLLLSTFLIQLIPVLRLEITDCELMYEILFTIQRTSRLTSTWLFVLLVVENLVLMKSPVGAKRWKAESWDLKCVILVIALSAIINISYTVTRQFGLYSDVCLVQLVMSYCMFLLGFPLPLIVSIVVMVCIARITRRILRYRRQRRQSVISVQSVNIPNQNVPSPVRKVTKMLIVYLLTLTFLFFPSYIFQFLELTGLLTQYQQRWGHIITIVRDVVLIMCCLSSSMHFVIFHKYSSNYRQALGYLVTNRSSQDIRKLSLLTETETLMRRRRSTIDIKELGSRFDKNTCVAL